MDNEATRLINDEILPNRQTISEAQTQSESQTVSKSKKGHYIAAAVGGVVVGAVAGAASAMAASTPNNDEGSAEEQENKTIDETSKTPTQEEAILANDEGIRYAHIDASDFNDAFAQARQQVGAGGVFEYNGRIYGTYYADEWNNMSEQERVDFQSRVSEVAPVHHAVSQPNHSNSHSAYANESITSHEVAPEEIPSNAEMISAEPVDNEIRVLGVEAVQNENGQIMNVALVENNGDQALLVDVNNNGMIDVLIHDDDRDGMVSEMEVHDISEAGIKVNDLLQAQAAQGGDTFYTANDDMPDYINDADSIMNV